MDYSQCTVFFSAYDCSRRTHVTFARAFASIEHARKQRVAWLLPGSETLLHLCRCRKEIFEDVDLMYENDLGVSTISYVDLHQRMKEKREKVQRLQQYANDAAQQATPEKPGAHFQAHSNGHIWDLNKSAPPPGRPGARDADRGRPMTPPRGDTVAPPPPSPPVDTNMNSAEGMADLQNDSLPEPPPAQTTAAVPSLPEPHASGAPSGTALPLPTVGSAPLGAPSGIPPPRPIDTPPSAFAARDNTLSSTGLPPVSATATGLPPVSAAVTGLPPVPAGATGLSPVPATDTGLSSVSATATGLPPVSAEATGLPPVSAPVSAPPASAPRPARALPVGIETVNAGAQTPAAGPQQAYTPPQQFPGSQQPPGYGVPDVQPAAAVPAHLPSVPAQHPTELPPAPQESEELEEDFENVSFSSFEELLQHGMHQLGLP